jgi:lysophospholipase L1-like esterase
MKFLPALVWSLPLFAQTPAPVETTATLATRMCQLMESTAVAVPDLIRASEPVRQLAEGTLASLKAASGNSVPVWRFIGEVKAYLALSDAYPAPQLPPTAAQQFAELREDLVRIRQRFEAGLESEIAARAAVSADPASLQRYSDANAKLPPLGAAPRIVFIGDSITDGWPLGEYFPGRDFVNRGIGGQTTLQMLGRFQQDVVMARPKAVVILGGTNDIARGIAPGEVEDALNMMGDLAKAHGIKPIFASVLPVRNSPGNPRRPETIQQINRWLQDYCHREGFGYLDYFVALADAGGGLPIDLSEDGLHPNEKGYRVMAPVALDAINRALAVTVPAPPPAPRKRFGLPVIK